jgi:hypothetical protein
MAVVPAQITSCDPVTALRSFATASYVRSGRSPTRSEALVLLAGAAHETAFFTRLTNNGVAGVKGGAAWTGDVAEHVTHEIEHGERVQKTQLFRAYPSVFAGFVDWLRLLAEGYPEALKGAAQGDPEKYVAGLLKGWGRGAHYFTADPAEYLAGVWASLRRLEAFPGLPWEQCTSRRVAATAPGQGGVP